MSDRWTERLSEYIDGELSAEERAQLREHLAGCAECARAVEDLRRIVESARALEDRAPGEDLWPGIAARIAGAPAGRGRVIDEEGERRAGPPRVWRRRFTFSLPQLAAASVALMMLSGGGGWLLTRSEAPLRREVPNQPGFVSALPQGYGEETFTAAVADLQRVLDANRARMDPATAQAIEESIAKIDRAIGHARRALAEDPASEYLHDHLASTMKLKLDFMRETAALVAAS